MGEILPIYIKTHISPNKSFDIPVSIILAHIFDKYDISSIPQTIQLSIWKILEMSCGPHTLACSCSSMEGHC